MTARPLLRRLADRLRPKPKPLVPNRYEIVDTYDGLVVRIVGTNLYLGRGRDGGSPGFCRKDYLGDWRLWIMEDLDYARLRVAECEKRDAAEIAYIEVCRAQKVARRNYVEKVVG